MTQKLWKLVKIGDCCQVVSGSTPRRNKPEYWNGFIDWVTPKDLSNLNSPVLKEAPERITELGYKSCSTTLLPKGTVLFSSRAPIGLVAIAGKEMCTNQGFKSLVPSDNVNSSYLYWCMKHFTPYIASQGAGSTFKEVSKAIVSKFKIPLPPIEEQKRIAAILDKADEVRRKRQEAIRLTEELARSQFLHMFGDPVTNPKKWVRKRLGLYISYSNNGLSRRRKISTNQGEVVLRIQDVKNNYIDYSKLNRIPLNDKDKTKYLLEKGDLLFIRVNGNKEYVGRCAVFDGFNETVYHNDHIIRIKTSENISSRYLSFLFNDVFGKKILADKIKTSAGQYTISQKGIESLEIPIPPIYLQDKFISLFQVNDRLKAKHHKIQEDTEDLFNSLLQRAFKGEL